MSAGLNYLNSTSTPRPSQGFSACRRDFLPNSLPRGSAAPRDEKRKAFRDDPGVAHFAAPALMPEGLIGFHGDLPRQKFAEWLSRFLRAFLAVLLSDEPLAPLVFGKYSFVGNLLAEFPQGFFKISSHIDFGHVFLSHSPFKANKDFHTKTESGLSALAPPVRRAFLLDSPAEETRDHIFMGCLRICNPIMIAEIILKVQYPCLSVLSGPKTGTEHLKSAPETNLGRGRSHVFGQEGPQRFHEPVHPILRGIPEV